RAMEHERPKALHALACEQLRTGRVVRPAVDVLVRLIGAARESAHAATSEALTSQLSGPNRAGELDGLLELREAGGVTWHEWLRTPAADSAPAAILAQLAKFEQLQSLGGGEVDLSMLAPGRVRMLAADARRRSAWEITRLAATRRHPLLLVFMPRCCASAVMS
ncbi:MAG: Tn3 family transposase, partial [Actinobacteria bacterium]|nr:Tn3 family transposase [Actinomycetota bacterium]